MHSPLVLKGSLGHLSYSEIHDGDPSPRKMAGGQTRLCKIAPNVCFSGFCSEPYVYTHSLQTQKQR